MEKCVNEAKSEICDLYMKEKNGSAKPAYGCYKRILNKVKKDRNLPNNFYFPYDTAFRRIQNKIKLDRDGVPVGNVSPLYEIEETMINVFIMLGKIGSPVSCGHGVKLINDMITNTVHQKRLIQYKRDRGVKQSEYEMGRIGPRYWYNFLNKYKNQIVSKKGKRFELNRSKWTRYKNFANMYDNVEEEMLQAGVATKLAVPSYMDKDGNVTQDRKIIKGMKCRSELTKPDMCIVLDEVGSNLCMVNDGHIGGKRYVCQRGDEPKTPSTKKDKHFTCLGLTGLDGQPIMCVVIIDSKKRDLLVQTGVDTSCLRVDTEVQVGDDEFSFLERNIGAGSQYPGGPTCKFRDKEIPCMVEFNPGGGMTATILTNIFRTLDSLEVYKKDREEGCRPFVLLDGHQTRFELEFLDYINDPLHPWSVCIGVPYGTSLWQVGDSTEQNGNFKVRLNQKKEMVLGRRLETMMSVELVSTDIIPLVNYAWDLSFALVDSNKKAIWERGWCPLNRNLLLHPSLRETMTDIDIMNEQEEGLNPMLDKNLVGEYPSNSTTAEHERVPTMRTNTCNTPRRGASNDDNLHHHDINFSQGLSQYYIKQVIKKADLEAARASIENDKKDGINKKELLNRVSRVTASSLMKVDTFVLNTDVRDEIKSRLNIKREEKAEKKKKDEAALIAQQEAVDKVIEKNRGKVISDWTITDIKVLIRPEKRKEDGPMPKSKPDLIALYMTCLNRNRRIPLLGAHTDGNVIAAVEEGVILPQIEENGRAKEESANLPVQKMM
jgi:hypothetical protein